MVSISSVLKPPVGAFSVIVKTGCGTDGSICGTSQLVVRRMLPRQLSGLGNNADWVLTESRDKCFAQSFQSPEMG